MLAAINNSSNWSGSDSARNTIYSWIHRYPSGGPVPPSISNIVQTPLADITSSNTVSVSADVLMTQNL